MSVSVQYPALVGCTVSSTGTGNLILDATPLAGPFTHPKDVLTDGQVVTACTRDDVSFEMGTYTFHSAGGPYGSFSRTHIDQSSTAPGAARTQNPINWTTPGVRNFFCTVPGTGLLLAANNLSEVNAVSSRSNLGLGTAAVLNVGTAANQVVQLTAAAKLPAVDGSLLTNLPSGGWTPPSGTKMWFYQAVAPTGTTKITTINDTLLGVTSGTGGNPAGGTTGNTGGWDNSFGISVNAHTLTTAEIPSHTHDVPTNSLGVLQTGSSFNSPSAGGGVIATTTATGGGGGHSHTLSGASTWRPPQAFGLICSVN